MANQGWPEGAMLKRVTLILASVLTCAVAPIALAKQGPIATTDMGRVRGLAEAGVNVFRGIPYAAPPVGPGRWREPAPAIAWTGVRDASRYGTACQQPPDRKEAWAQVGPTGEDCLFLNVWRPATAGTYPVMVFLHGGSFTYGAAGVPLYDGARLSRRGVVVVTLNYRLGLLGFFAHPALTRENPDGPLGNYGVMDQIAALRWVQRNIAFFGGDPHNVTLFGESAGAGAVQLLMGSPAATGLFQKAISESGSGGFVLAPLRGVPVSAEALGARWAESVGLKDATADQLRALPPDKLLQRSFPFIDGKVVVASPGAPFERGREAKIPLLIGANSNEASLAGIAEPKARAVLGAPYDAFAQAYEKARPGVAPEVARVDLAEDALSVLPSVSIAVMHATNGAPAYSYYFDQLPSNRREGSAGTPHGGELEYLFGNPYEGSTWDEGDRAVSDLMAGYWVRFARTGDPNGDGAPAWPLVNGGALPRYLTIGTPTRAASLTPIEEDVRKAALGFSAAGWTTER
jgi:para-nitrobenzyl esterase